MKIEQTTIFKSHIDVVFQQPLLKQKKKV